MELIRVDFPSPDSPEKIQYVSTSVKRDVFGSSGQNSTGSLLLLTCFPSSERPDATHLTRHKIRS